MLKGRANRIVAMQKKAKKQKNKQKKTFIPKVPKAQIQSLASP